MKPLTIEQLNSLEVGDYIWYERLGTNTKGYIKKNTTSPDVFCMFIGHPVDYSDYGKTWLAWKNKEQAECKGEIVDLPCLRDIEDFIENDGTRVRMKELNYMERGRIYSIPYVEGQFEEAERRLAEVTKE